MEEVNVLQSPPVNAEREARMLETFQKSFEEVQTIFNQNSMLIREISHNQENGKADSGSLARNVGLIRELNSNMGQVVQLYANISVEVSKSLEEENCSLDRGRADGASPSRTLVSPEHNGNGQNKGSPK
ncbi:hypothetical protein GOP47_0017135 [Adiantum capillus-veneris]|uniref:Protein EARLY FLOWERING 4 domain-containing protein n=1 Tax=Adiantum capillus-veneris TaxID=13818 RepID=A0A9D4UJ41_ADICA|nr:hypothetical protein GOP47_0017135 [Adiantum capillus-veneris]